MDVVTRAFAAHHEMDDVLKADAPLAASRNKARGKRLFATIDQLSAALAVSPRLIAIGNAHALTPRARALAITSIIQTEISMGAVEKGKPISELPLVFQGNAENVKLFQDHKEELRALKQKYPMTLF